MEICYFQINIHVVLLQHFLAMLRSWTSSNPVQSFILHACFGITGIEAAQSVSEITTAIIFATIYSLLI